MDANAPLAERQRNTAGADAEFEGPAFSCQIGEEANDRINDGRLEQVSVACVVPLSHPFIEVVPGHGRTVPQAPVCRHRLPLERVTSTGRSHSSSLSVTSTRGEVVDHERMPLICGKILRCRGHIRGRAAIFVD